jgi:nucleotide-binding universal stress UspA family protein
MRKILVAIDAQNVNSKAIDFASYAAVLTKSRLTGVFLENIIFEEMSELAGVSSYSSEISSLEERNKKTEENILFFREACEKRGVTSNIHRKRGMPTDEMIEESRFADMIIVDAEMSFKKKIESVPSEFVKNLLEEAECPVIISPQSFDGIDEIIFSYNGSGSSVLAIKQFTYLFPEFHNKKITLLEVNKEDENTIRSKPKISEWLKAHYDEIDFKLLNGSPEEELYKYLLGKENLLLVMGAFGRGVISSLLKPSRAKLIVSTTNFPIFISHR